MVDLAGAGTGHHTLLAVLDAPLLRGSEDDASRLADQLSSAARVLAG